MRISDSRYARERTQFELAMRMIAYEARTCTIRTCTGLSDDRIRKIYTTYFKAEPHCRCGASAVNRPPEFRSTSKPPCIRAKPAPWGCFFAMPGS